jgi:hypothetical protein
MAINRENAILNPPSGVSFLGLNNVHALRGASSVVYGTAAAELVVQDMIRQINTIKEINRGAGAPLPDTIYTTQRVINGMTAKVVTSGAYPFNPMQIIRERLAEERKDLSTISIVFYAPVFGRPAETGPPSPEFLIQRDSREGKLLDAAFAAVKNKKRPFNAKAFNLDPEGMIRVRVKIRRSGEMEARAFEIVELKACHWYSTDLPGFDVGKEGEVKN